MYNYIINKKGVDSLATKILKDKIIHVRATSKDVAYLDTLVLLLDESKSDIISKSLEFYYKEVKK